MRHVSILILCAALALAACGCKKKPATQAQAVAAAPANAAGVRIGWKFVRYTKPYEGNPEIEFPYTDIWLMVDGQGPYLLGVYMGSAVELEPDQIDAAGFPAGAIIACQIWYAGAGDDFCVRRKERGTLSVLRQEKEEGSADEDGYSSGFKVIKVIKIPVDAKLSISRCIVTAK